MTPLGRRRYEWEENFRMAFIERGWKVLEWIHLAQHKFQRRGLMNTAIKLRVP